MKKANKSLILFVFLLLTFSLFFCGKRCSRHESVVVNTDSLFIDLGKLRVEQKAKMTDKLFTGFARNGMNGVVLYAEQGQVIYEKAFGWRDLSKRQKDSLRIDDAFQLSSDSKMFTAEAIMLLKAEGKLDYDDDIRKYIPELPYEGITIRQLLTHRSGLPRYDAMADNFWPDRKKPFSNEAMIKMLAEKKPEVYGAPNASFFYNNVNYALLASVVERVSKQHFEDFMRERIFEPSGMTHSYIYSMRDDTEVSMYVPTKVQGHDLYKSGPAKTQNDYLNGVMGDKIMYSTVEDIWLFNKVLDNHLLLPDSLQAEAFEPGSPEWKNDENYGFGWRMNRNYPGIYFHYGWWKGYRSVIVRDTTHHRFLVVLNNTTWLIPPDVIWDFINDTSIVLPEAEPWGGRIISCHQ
ncbi:MAG: beta-lactamase family protein [Bacteroidales bacterium]|nr:beta-lactamase family protein [Bacteroidales bacterium]